MLIRLPLGPLYCPQSNQNISPLPPSIHHSPISAVKNTCLATLTYPVLKMQRENHKLTDPLYPFQNARQVGLCLLPTVPHLQCNTSKSTRPFQFLFHMFGESYHKMSLYRFITLVLVARVDFFSGRKLYENNSIACVCVCVCVLFGRFLWYGLLESQINKL